MKRESTNVKKNKGEGMCERVWKDEEKREIMKLGENKNKRENNQFESTSSMSVLNSLQ